MVQPIPECGSMLYSSWRSEHWMHVNRFANICNAHGSAADSCKNKTHKEHCSSLINSVHILCLARETSFRQMFQEYLKYNM